MGYNIQFRQVLLYIVKQNDERKVTLKLLISLSIKLDCFKEKFV